MWISGVQKRVGLTSTFRQATRPPASSAWRGGMRAYSHFAIRVDMYYSRRSVGSAIECIGSDPIKVADKVE